MTLKSTDRVSGLGLEIEITGYASLVTTETLSQQSCDQLTIWTKEPIEKGQLYRLETRDLIFNWPAWLINCFGTPPTIELHGRLNLDYRAAFIRDECLVALLTVSTSDFPPELSWIKTLCGQTIGLHDRRRLLSLKPPIKIEEGVLICHCFQIRESEIKTAIQRGDDSLEALQKSLRCGTNCGSCINSIKEILEPQPKSDLC